jgi:hypothetical protein
MLLSESTVERSLETVVAFQTPWGEWGSVADQVKRSQRVRRFFSPLIPKPNGFRTLVALETLREWLSDGYEEPADLAQNWFEDCFEDGWFRIVEAVPRSDVGPIGDPGPSFVMDSIPDTRHTAQAITSFVRHSSLKVEHVDVLHNLVKRQRKTGAWTFKPGRRSEIVFSTMSCLEMLEAVLESKAEFTVWIAQDAAFARKLQRSLLMAVNFFVKNLFVHDQCRDLFDVSICINRLQGIFSERASFLNSEALRLFRNSWNEDRGCWIGREQDDEIELNALVYATFSQIADFEEIGDRVKLERVAGYLDEALKDAGDVTAHMFALGGHRAICQSRKNKMNKRRLDEVRLTDSFQEVQYAVYSHFLGSRLIALQSLMDIQGSDAIWNQAFEKERERATLLSRELVTAKGPKKEAALLKNLIENLENGDWREICESVAAYLPISDERTSSPWLERVSRNARELFLDFSAKFMAELVKPGP